MRNLTISKNRLKIRLLFTDLVVWGNEHESQPHLAESLVGTFRILQPGSSIATSMNETESSLCPKHIGLIEVRSDRKFRLVPIRLTQVRPFIFKDISLKDVPTLKSHDPKLEESIKTYLAGVVAEMIQESKELVPLVEEGVQSNEQITYRVKQPTQALLRLRVDPRGLPTVNQQRFGSQFVGLVANPGDLVTFQKKKATAKAAAADGGTNKLAKNVARAVDDEEEDTLGAGIHKIRVEELVIQSLNSSRKNLSILSESDLSLVQLILLTCFLSSR